MGESREGKLNPTLIETLIGLIPLNYYQGSLMLILLLLCATLSSLYLDSGDLRVSFTIFFRESWLPRVIYVIENIVLPVYALGAIRFMRTRILSADPGLMKLPRDGEATLIRFFSPVSSSLPAVAVGILLFLPSHLVNGDGGM
jgi:hypothetical protein